MHVLAGNNLLDPNMKKLLLFLVSSLCCVALANEFVVKPKKKKKTSCAKLKEQCCQSFGDQHNCLSDVVKAVVDLQQLEFDTLVAEVDGDSRLVKVDKSKLQQLVDRSAQFEQDTQTYMQKIRDYHSLLRSL